MGDFDYSTGRPRMPQFREADGRMDWRQIADMFIPGNVWNSRTNQYRPLGIASGVTGLPIEGAVALGRGAGSFLQSIGRGGRNLFGGRREGMPDFSSSFGRIGNDAANYRGGRNFIDMDNSRIAQEARNTVSDIEDFRRGGGGSRSERGESPIGLGQLGRGGDEALIAASRAQHSRNGALMER
jgi:hypothetical protein